MAEGLFAVMEEVMPNQFTCKILRTFILVGAVFFVAISSGQSDPLKAQDKFDSIKSKEWISDLHPSIGKASAPIKVVFFVDYQCPSCRIVDSVVRSAISKREDVALIYREFPLQMHPLAKQAAIVAENARSQGTFDLAHKRLMEGQSLTEVAIKDAARRAGVSTKATKDSSVRIESDHSIEQIAKLNYVPSFVVVADGVSMLMNRKQVLEYLK